MKKLKLLHGEVELPNFFPDGTYGTVKSLDSRDLSDCHVGGAVMNTFHLYSKPGLSIIRKHKGINNFLNFMNPILTDSGGFQVFSLLRENPKNGQINDNEIIFRPDQGGDKIIFSPEKCIQLQFAYRSDIIMCLDWCTHPDDSIEIQTKSVEITIKWAKRCRQEYELQLKNYKYSPDNRPLIFAIIQGGNNKELRRFCAEKLIEIGFDGFGYGGWPVDTEGKLTDDILRYTAALMPEGSVKYAMGLGRPEEIVSCVGMGYNLFDCVIPTREARHQRLYAYNADSIDKIDLNDDKFYSYLYIMDEKHIADTSPVSPACDCYCCRNYSKSYLRHLYAVGDPLAYRLATIHNLRFYTILMEKLRAAQNDG